jgi:hypothetical protein
LGVGLAIRDTASYGIRGRPTKWSATITMTTQTTDPNGAVETTATTPAPGGPGTVDDASKAFFGALFKSAEDISGPPAGDPKVIAAIQLGWLAGDLKAVRPIDRLDGEDVPERAGRRAQAIRLDQLRATLSLTSTTVQTTIDHLRANDGAAAARSIQDWDVLGPLLGADARLARAYLLGDELNTLRNTPYEHSLFSDARAARIIERLDQLSTVLPPHAGRGVGNAVRRWCEFEKDPDLDGTDPPTPQDVLMPQCDLWYRVVTGQKRAVELLEPANYTDAGVRLTKKLGRDLWSVIAPIWPAALGLLLLLAAGLAVVIAGAGGTGATAAGLSVIVGAFGLTWKGVGGTVGRLVGNLEEPLWNAEIDGAVTEAALLLPQKAHDPSLRERRKETYGGDYAGRAARVQREHATGPATPANSEHADGEPRALPQSPS